MEENFMTKYDKLSSFYHRLIGFRSIMPRTEETKNKKKIVYKNAVNLYNKLLAIYFKDYNSIADEEKEKVDKKYDQFLY